MRKHIWNLGQILLGGTAMAVAIQMLLVPNDLVIGGISGLAIIVRHLTGWPTGVLIFLINAPIFLMALRTYGFRFLLTALFGVGVTSILVDTLALVDFVLTDSMILVAIYSGVLIGAAVALLFRAGSATGGVDILARFGHRRWPRFTLGSFILCIDGTIILFGALVFGQIELAMYAAIAAFTLKKTVDLILQRDKAKVTT